MGQPTETDVNRRCELRIRGMDCAEEIDALRQVLLPLVGSEDRLAFDLLSAKLVVSLPPDCSDEAVLAAIETTGMRASPFQAEDSEPAPAQRWSMHSLLTLLSCGLSLSDC